jgi:regulation of enolase protein 1 (concanavalin A-like superfamily)
MTMPKAYEPMQGQKYQILCKYKNDFWEHCDYARTKEEKDFLLKEYKLAYGNEFTFKTILLPKKYHKEYN